MTWASLWWRVCLLGRIHRRRLSVAWRLLRRRHRRPRPVLVPSRLQEVLSFTPGAAISLNHYSEIGYVVSDTQRQQADAFYGMTLGQHKALMAQQQAMQNMAPRTDSPYLAAMMGQQAAQQQACQQSAMLGSALGAGLGALNGLFGPTRS